MKPLWTIRANGADITARLTGYLVSLTVTDKLGYAADEIEVVVADPRAEIEVPSYGAQLEVSLGYVETGAVPMGTFTANTIELSSPPRQLVIRAQGADLSGELLTRRSKDWEDTTIAQIVGTIANQHGLQAAVGAGLGGRKIKRFDQTNESDISFLTRLGQTYDAIVTVKDGHLLFSPRGEGSSASGTAITAIALTPLDVTDWHFSVSTEAVATTVEATFYDRETAAAEVVQAKRPVADRRNRWADTMAQKEQQYGLPAGLLSGVAMTESRFNPEAVSPAGAKGLMQFMPATAARFGLTNPFDPVAAIDAAGRYLKWLLARYSGNLDHAVYAYNWGEGNIDKWRAGQRELPNETKNYLPQVKAGMKAADTGTGPTIRLRQTFVDRGQAQTAADSQSKAIARSAATAKLTMPGRTVIAAETPLDLTGFDPAFDARWIVTIATHTISSAGYVTSVEAERKL